MEKVGRVVLTEQVTCELRLVLSENESCTYLEEEASRPRGQAVQESWGWKYPVCWRNSRSPEPGTKAAGGGVGAELIAITEGTTWLLVAGGKDFGFHSTSIENHLSREGP